MPFLLRLLSSRLLLLLSLFISLLRLSLTTALLARLGGRGHARVADGGASQPSLGPKTVADIRVCVCVRVCVYIYIYIICVYVYTYIYIYIYTHMGRASVGAAKTIHTTISCKGNAHVIQSWQFEIRVMTTHMN